MAFIEIKNAVKSYFVSGRKFSVLKNINLEIEKGDIFGIVGFSGAGKSTLIRCLNSLESIDEGSMKVGGHEVKNLSGRDLNLYRQKIGVIFQHFNLLDSRTVFQNAAFPLEISHKSKSEISDRVNELLKLVDIADKKDFYPGQLSGGQKQRVAIARALANNPDILLSDEATSALDPINSLSVLDLIKDINAKLGLTIVLIAHQLDIVRYACKNVAVIEDGEIVESGPVKEVFRNPKSKTARLFIKINEDLSQSAWDWSL